MFAKTKENQFLHAAFKAYLESAKTKILLSQHADDEMEAIRLKKEADSLIIK